jgi:hypothetical protein
MFGEWYQKTNKTEDTNNLTSLALKNRHPSQHTRSVCPLSSTEFVEPPEKKSWLRHCWHLPYN